MHECYVEKYSLDEDFKDVYATFCQGNQVKELDYHVHDKLLYHSWQAMYSTGIKSQHHKGSTYFSYCWSFWCRQDNDTITQVLLLASYE